MSDRIETGLKRLFDEHRIVFWYDAARDMRGEYDAVDLPDVQKVEIANNEFGLKYRMLRQEPKQKFLVFHDGPAPEMADNWLLDLYFACGVFKADQAAIWLAELGLPLQFEDVVRDHMEFYRAKGRIEALKQMLTPSDTQDRCAAPHAGRLRRGRRCLGHGRRGAAGRTGRRARRCDAPDGALRSDRVLLEAG